MFAKPIHVVLGVCLFALVALAGCQRNAPAPPAMPPPVVTVARPVMYPVQSYYEYNGHLEAVETVEIRARVKGLLQEVQFADGEELEAGAPLYTIDPREYRTGVARSTADLAKATADIDNWKAQIKLAETEYNRVSRLPAGTVTPSEIDKARATVDVNKAQLAVAQASKDSATAALQTANIQLGYTDIRSPITGRISRTLITKGNLVGQDMPTLLTTIVSVDPLFVYFDAPERDLVKYQRDRGAKNANAPNDSETTIEIGVATEAGFPHRGKIDFRENKVDVGTGTIRLRGRIPNPLTGPNASRLLYPGLYSRVRVPAGAAESRPVIPEEALMTGQDGRFVYVLGPGEVIEKRSVTVGTRIWQASADSAPGAPAWALVNPAPAVAESGQPAPLRLAIRSIVAIDKGLSSDDRIVVIGLQKARPGAPVAPENWDLKPPMKSEAGK